MVVLTLIIINIYKQASYSRKVIKNELKIFQTNLIFSEL